MAPSSQVEELGPALRRAWSRTASPRCDAYRVEAAKRLAECLRPGCRVLDVGAGRSPFIPVDERPDGCTYVGLDISAEELRSAPAGAYDDVVVGDVTRPVPALADSFDLVVSWQLLEHVRPLDGAFETIRASLRPGGRFIGQLSGRYSFFALAGRMLPAGAAKMALRIAQGRDPATVFPAYYDRCWASALRSLLAGWSHAEVAPHFAGDPYLTRSRLLLAANAAYEQWAMRRGHDDLATHYMIDAVR